MLKALRFLALLSVLAMILFCYSDDNVMTAPYDRYDHKDLFVVLNNDDGKYYVLEFTLKYNKEYDLAAGLSFHPLVAFSQKGPRGFSLYDSIH